LKVERKSSVGVISRWADELGHEGARQNSVTKPQEIEIQVRLIFSETLRVMRRSMIRRAFTPLFNMKLFHQTLTTITILLVGIPLLSEDRPNRNRGGGNRMADTIHVGDPAPDFILKTIDGKHEVTLSDYKGMSPVVLIFGSYT
jgi:AhpC/TSA family